MATPGALPAPGRVAVRSLALLLTYAGGSLAAVLPPLCSRPLAVARRMAAAEKHGGVEAIARGNLVPASWERPL